MLCNYTLPALTSPQYTVVAPEDVQTARRILGSPTQFSTDRLEVIANHTNGIRANDKLYLEAHTVLKGLCQLVTQMIGLRDPYTENHSRQVADLSVRIARHSLVQFSADNLIRIHYAALLHDVGKAAITEAILNLPRPLNEAEIVMVRQHTVLGHRLIAPLDLDPMIGNVVLSHHENYDGTGYPQGLGGSEIPVAARIVRLADTYDALIGNRPYRAAHSHADTLEMMCANHHQFDPRLFEAFLATVNGKC
ncbi:MAG: HD domain-containing protein [Chloroflexi bacterium]|nr:HD domain-containing protein [Chloroflexota bacterium]